MISTNVNVKVDASKAIEQTSLPGLCVAAVNRMVEDGIEKHVQFIRPEDEITFGLKEGGRIPKVTIEFVEASEALTKVCELANVITPLTKIGDTKGRCLNCSWSGTVDEAVPDVDGDGSLGCPNCSSVVNFAG